MKSGLLLINLGTPDAPNPAAVKRYLREFLSDGRVIDLPWIVRQILVQGVIIPFRTKQSSHAYQAIWSAQGSPLLYHSMQLAEEVKKILSKQYVVSLGMRYGSPSIEEALYELRDCPTITVIPLYPQYSSAASGSAIEATLDLLRTMEVIPSIKIISHFYQHPAYVKAQAEFIRLHSKPDHHLLFSYHGIPERQIKKSGCNKPCPSVCPTGALSYCYKAQCYDTSRSIARYLNLPAEQFSTSFQSRLGKTPWIKPYTDELIAHLAQQGVKKIDLACPSFVADCLETLEEIGMRAREQWMQLGGNEFNLIPAMNSHPLWVQAIVEISKNTP